jgi:cell division septation protein DedD
MSDKDQFTFEDEDESPESGVTKKEEPQEPDAGGGEVFFDTGESLPGKGLGKQADPGESDSASEEFFFDTEDEDSEPEQAEQSGFDPSEGEQESFSGDADLFGDNLNAGFPESEEEIDDPVDFAPEPQEKGGGSKNRTLLMVLLLVVVAAGGAYYFMGMSSSTPSVPTVQIPAEKPAKVVAVPPPPAKSPAAKPAKVVAVPPPPPPAKVSAEKAAPEKKKPVTVAVPPPPAPPAAKAEAKPAPAVAKAEAKPAPVKAAPAPVEKPKQAPVKPATTSVAVPAPVPVKPAPAIAEKAPTVAPAKAEETAVAKTAVATKPVAAPKQVADGAYALDAGSYLLKTNRKALVEKIEKLGYEVFVTPVEATLDMTRLRLGTYSKEEVQTSLFSAREIEPGSYSAPAGDGYVIYAGTFLKSRNLEKIKERFLKEGIQVKSEPVQVVRTLSRVRFGSFASKADAATAANEVEKAGVKAVVVKAK